MHQGLINKDQVIKVMKLDRLGLEPMAGPIMKIARLDKLNQIYSAVEDTSEQECLKKIIHLLDIKLSLSGKGLQKIPQSGPFIAISNHPFGLLDGIILLHLITSIRPDFKVMANFLLGEIAPLRSLFIHVNPFQNGQDASNISGIKQILKHLNEGHPAGIFPAGEVSSFNIKQGGVTDREWQKSVLKIIQKTHVPVIPVYFQGINSALFQVLGLLHPALRTAAIPTEFFKKSHSEIKVHVGKPIHPREYSHIENTELLGRYLRARTYALKSGLDVDPFFRKESTSGELQEVTEPASPNEIAEELASIRPESLLFKQGNFEVYNAEAYKIPLVLRELGRLREETFRAVGEGTGKSSDIDEYDLYYRHLFVWDAKNQSIAGAYRLGIGNEIMLRYGRNGFYLHSLFKMKKPFRIFLPAAIELGRSFVKEEYQRQRLPLYLLWKGVSVILQRNPQIRYLIGPVSISNHYSSVSRSLMVAFIKKYYFDKNLGEMVKPRKKFRPARHQLDFEGLLAGINCNVNFLDKVIEDIEPRHTRLPVLLKKYIYQNARIIGFNVDPNFCHSLDGFMVLDLKNLPGFTLEKYF